MQYADVTSADMLKQALEMRGYDCFMDFEALTVGNFQKELELALQGTPVVVVCLTPGSLTKDARWPGAGRAEEGSIDYLQREVDLAKDSARRRLTFRSPCRWCGDALVENRAGCCEDARCEAEEHGVWSALSSTTWSAQPL